MSGPARRLVAALALFVCGLTASAEEPAKAVPAPGWLQRLIVAAQERHPSVQAQGALLDAADAGLASARWQFYPTPSAAVQGSAVSSNDPSAGASRVITTAGLSQPLWTWGRLEAGVDKAQAQLLMARAGRAEARQQLALRVIQACGEWLAADRKRQAYAAGIAVQQRMIDQVRRRIAEGQAAPADQALADGRQAALRAEAAQADLQARGALARLQVLVGEALAEPDLAAAPLLPWPLADDLPLLQQQAAQHAPALARLQAQVAVLEAGVREQQARLKPELQARLELQRGQSSTTLANGSSTQARLFVGFVTQFGAGLSSLSAVGEARARQAAAQADVEAQRLALAEQVIADHLVLQGAARRRADLVQSLASAQGVVQSWDRQYLAGRKTWQDLMNAVREEVQLRVQIADFDAVQVVTSWRLALVTGALPVLASTVPLAVPALKP